MLPASSNSSSLLFPGPFIQCIKRPNFSFQRVYSEFDKFTTRRSFCSQTNVITASQPSQGAWTNRITDFRFRWDFEDIHPRHICMADYHISKASFTWFLCTCQNWTPFRVDIKLCHWVPKVPFFSDIYQSFQVRGYNPRGLPCELLDSDHHLPGSHQ